MVLSVTAQPPWPPPLEPTVQVRMSEPERTPAFPWSPGQDSKASASLHRHLIFCQGPVWVPLAGSSCVAGEARYGLGTAGRSPWWWAALVPLLAISVGGKERNGVRHKDQWSFCWVQEPGGWEHCPCGLTIFRTLMMSCPFPKFQALHLKLHVFD